MLELATIWYLFGMWILKLGAQKLGKTPYGDMIPSPESDTDSSEKSGLPAGAMAQQSTREVAAPLVGPMAIEEDSSYLHFDEFNEAFAFSGG